MRTLLSTEPLKDGSGVFIFSYPKGIFYIMLVVTALLTLGLLYDPPTETKDVAIAIFIIGSALFVCIESCKFNLLLKDNIIIRNSPWPWHRETVFEINRVSEIVAGGYPIRLRIKMNNGTELAVPLLLRGAFRLLQTAANNSNAAVTNDAKKIIDYYAARSDNR